MHALLLLIQYFLRLRWRWLLEALSAPFELVTVTRDFENMAAAGGPANRCPDPSLSA